MRVALVRLTALGDIIHSAVSLQFIKDSKSDLNLTWLVEEKFSQILEYNSDLDTILPLNLHALKSGVSLKKISDIKSKIDRVKPFDLAIDAQGLIKSAIVAKLASKKVAGLDFKSIKEPLGSLLYSKRFRVSCKEVAPFRFSLLISKALGINLTKEMLLNKKPYLFYNPNRNRRELDSYFSKEQKNIVIITSASNLSKTYPANRWIELIRELKGVNTLLIAGSKKERDEAKKIASSSNSTLLPPLDLDNLKYAIRRSDLLIGGDTGPSHIAWAMNKPSILLFGSTPKSMMFETPKNIAITSGAKVNPCRFDKRDRSIQNIKAKEILNQVERLL